MQFTQRCWKPFGHASVPPDTQAILHDVRYLFEDAPPALSTSPAVQSSPSAPAVGSKRPAEQPADGAVEKRQGSRQGSAPADPDAGPAHHLKLVADLQKTNNVRVVS